MIGAVLSIMMLGMIGLLIGAFVLWRRGGSAKQITLMLVLVLVIGGNLALIIWPDANGERPLLEAAQPE